MGFDDWNLAFAKRIVTSHRWHSFIGGLTKGPRGIGKSMYDLKTMAYAYYIVEGITEDDAWKRALDNFIFRPDQLSRHIEYNIAHDEVSLVWCIDDAAVHFSSYLFFINVFQAALMNASFDTIRSVVNALLLNCTEKTRLLKSLRSYDDYEITIYMDRNYQRKAVGIKWYSLPDGKRKFRKAFEDYYSCHVPNWVYEEYMLMRKKYLKEINEELVYLREKLSERKDKTLKPMLSA